MKLAALAIQGVLDSVLRGMHHFREMKAAGAPSAASNLPEFRPSGGAPACLDSDSKIRWIDQPIGQQMAWQSFEHQLRLCVTKAVAAVLIAGQACHDRRGRYLPGNMADGMDDIVEEDHPCACQDPNGAGQQQNLDLRLGRQARRAPTFPRSIALPCGEQQTLIFCQRPLC